MFQAEQREDVGTKGIGKLMHEMSLSDYDSKKQKADGVTSSGQPVERMQLHSSSGRWGKVLSTTTGSGADAKVMNYTTDDVAGNGSFGVVYKATCQETGETVAIKKVLQDRRFKNRELQIMRSVDHPNIVRLVNCFVSQTDKHDTYLYLVLEYVPDTLYRVSKAYAKAKKPLPFILVKLYAYQMCRALAALHREGICHRDIKPQNLLLDPATHVLKVCDFGSAKILVKGEPNIAYICSRYYRAPELIFGATEYTTAIDVWSVACVVAELLAGHPLFPGENGVDQLVEIIKVLGTPSRQEIHDMNPHYTDFRFPTIKKMAWNKVLAGAGGDEATRSPKEVQDLEDAKDLLQRLLVYSPQQRLSAIQALAHPFFDELREPGCQLPKGVPLPPLFDWTPGELKNCSKELQNALQPRTREGTTSEQPPPTPQPRSAADVVEPSSTGGMPPTAAA